MLNDFLSQYGIDVLIALIVCLLFLFFFVSSLLYYCFRKILNLNKLIDGHNEELAEKKRAFKEQEQLGARITKHRFTTEK